MLDKQKSNKKKMASASKAKLKSAAKAHKFDNTSDEENDEAF